MSKLIKNIDLKIKKQYFKIKYLKAELEDVNETLHLAIKSFRESCLRYAEENSLPVSGFDSGQDFEKSAKKDVGFIPSNAKKIYKNIAMLTHPDKLKDKSESERKRLKKMFLKSSQSIESGGIYDLLDTAIYLDLDVGVLGADELFNLYREAELVEKEIAFHKNTYEWKWYNSNKSDSVILDYLKHVNSLQFGKHIKKE